MVNQKALPGDLKNGHWLSRTGTILAVICHVQFEKTHIHYSTQLNKLLFVNNGCHNSILLFKILYSAKFVISLGEVLRQSIATVKGNGTTLDVILNDKVANNDFKNSPRMLIVY